MKHHAHIYLMLAALVLSGCRTATHSHRTVGREVDDSLSQVKESSARTVITQSTTTRTDSQTYDYRITRTFDTTQPVDSNTHLPRHAALLWKVRRERRPFRPLHRRTLHELIQRTKHVQYLIKRLAEERKTFEKYLDEQEEALS